VCILLVFLTYTKGVKTTAVSPKSFLLLGLCCMACIWAETCSVRTVQHATRNQLWLTAIILTPCLPDNKAP